MLTYADELEEEEVQEQEQEHKQVRMLTYAGVC
jgi:hypothetical protein